MMRKLTLSLALIGAMTLTTEAKKKPKEAEKPAPKSAINEKVKACKKIDGMFTLYQDTTSGSLYLLLKKEQLEKTYIYFGYTENGVVAAGHFRGSFRENAVFNIRRYYDRIEFVKQNTSFYFDTINAISKSANANISDAILVSQKIVAEEKGNMLIDASSIFLGEALSQIKPTPFPFGGMSLSLLGGLNKEKTKALKLRSYEKNTDVLVEYVYDNPAPLMRGGAEVTDPRSVSIQFQHSFIEAPDTPMVGRRDDQRVGFFTEQVNDMTTTNAVAFKDMIHRWKLEKKDPAAPISEPVKPIVWWIENTTPFEFREVIMEAGLKWNIAFEKAGFKNAVQIFVQPDTATWDAGDINYNVLRWTSSPQPPFGGYGPSFVDPRSGEILGADIMLEYIFITNRINQERLFDAKPSSLNDAQQPEQMDYLHYCDAGLHLHNSTLFGKEIIEMQGLNDVEKRDYLKQSLYYLVLHEMGHTMGLMHNMKASQIWNPTQAHNKMITEQIGLTGSVMDYPAVNVALDKTKQGEYFTTRPGPYDLWAIEYGYSQSLSDDTKEEERLLSILSRSTDSLLVFGNDADDMRAPGKGIDPRVNVNDFSNDAIAFSIDRIKLANLLITDIPKRYRADGKSNQEMRQAYTIAMGEMGNACNTVSRYIGGVYVDRNMKLDRPAYTPVALADQKKAMSTLSTYLFSANAFKGSEELYRNLQLQRRGFNFFGSYDDPKIHDRILFMQDMVMAHLLASTTMKRMNDSRLYGNKYTVWDMTTDLTNAIFREDLNGNVSTIRQNLQIEYVKNLTYIVQNNFGSYDNVSVSAAIGQLKSIRQMMSAPAASPEVKAHRDHLVMLIDEVFNKK